MSLLTSENAVLLTMTFQSLLDEPVLLLARPMHESPLEHTQHQLRV